MKIIDTHIHLADFKEINLDISAAIVPAIKQDDWKKIENLYNQNTKKVIPAFGVHPWYVNQASSSWLEELESVLIKYPNAIIGETGLDRHKNKEEEPQNRFFMEHIKLATKYNRPIIIHAVKCVDWLDNYWNDLKKVKFVFHSFNARRELLKKVINAGGYVSVSASILNNREKDKILPAIPLDRIMLETDGPYQKGNIKDIANEVSLILGIEYEEFLRIAYDNTIKFLSSDAII